MKNNDIVFEIACALAKNSEIGQTWVSEKYQVTIYHSNRLLTRAKKELIANPQKYLPIDDNWEETTIVPEHHKFNPCNLYGEVEPETFIITKQSKIND